MLLRRTLLTLSVAAALATNPWAVQAQAIFSDTAFPAASYDVSGVGNQDVRFGFNYATFDIFGDGFLVNSAAGIPLAPRTTDGSKTGLFVSANNDGTAALTQSFAAALPKGVNVGTGTANPNYVMRVDVFNSTGAGIDANGIPDGVADIGLNGTTNYTIVGINQTNTTVQVAALAQPGAGNANLTGQGQALAITGDTGGAEDYIPLYGGLGYRDRSGTAAGLVTGSTAGAKSGLAGQYINDYWLANGLINDDGVAPPADTVPGNEINIFTGDSLFFAPDPTNVAGYLEDGSGVDKSYYADAFKVSTLPLHYNQPSLAAPQTLAPNGSGVIADGVQGNQWATHELYFVDGKFTYVINGRPVVQLTPGPTTTFGANPTSTAGTALLGFWDRFGGSLAASPEGANFVIYDNLEIKTATAAEVPDMVTYLRANGYLPSPNDADFNNDGTVDGADLLIWQQGLGNSGAAATGTTGNANADTVVDGADLAVWASKFGGPPATAAAGAVPEPTTAILLASLAAVGLVRRRPKN